MDVEITAAGDAGDDLSYSGLKTLRSAVIQDLTARAASLPLVITLTLPTNLPSLVVAYRIYQDATRADEVTAETGVIHPAFLPPTMQVLAS
jgi:prophage DNA circulation protein